MTLVKERFHDSFYCNCDRIEGQINLVLRIAFKVTVLTFNKIQREFKKFESYRDTVRYIHIEMSL